ncbi:ubiE/COQ5 methyltransferase [Grosmannia clavigera kw1407]|uniref:UbiE/COQ5 methyltransferase n=1 Tax=Grosmannia clavigera (strain kw1407 / UAMH 11150) TaxID=655863 RepID=F0X7G1_GROCL|nr:ubiE/COQ5 methyltransferase [Grosmannia clavigera kw1407]EFX06248.1 ubiE/COQ5 methyltransferase [Grosmannia clavigera kw1407]
MKRTAEKDGAFLLPHLRKTDHILDVGCGPGSITAGFAQYVPEGTVVGVDISAEVLARATQRAAELGLATSGPGSVSFQQADVLAGLPYADDTFDAVYCSQVIPHLAPLDHARRAVAEMRRVLKPGGVLASRDGTETLFYPRHLDLGRLWVENNKRVIRTGAPAEQDISGASVPGLFRSAGFGADNETKISIGASTWVQSSRQERQWLAWRASGQLQPGDPFRQSWLDAGITEAEIEETLAAVRQWAEMDDAWMIALQTETLGWK